MTVKEAAERLGMKHKTLHRHIERGTELGRIFSKKGWNRFCYAHDLRKFVRARARKEMLNPNATSLPEESKALIREYLAWRDESFEALYRPDLLPFLLYRKKGSSP